ncbi:hypothetical protein BC628DRAFT_558690 [Trametes gibbosa]|nr:hypothetical protein BC628DRAFT_558690 [Trametes gibbosa]
MAPAQSSNVALLAGPQLIGFFFDWALQGILSMQIYIYHLLFPHDSRATKCLVYGVFVYEWVQTILVTQTAFEIDVYGFGDRSSLTTFHNTWFSVTIMCAILSAVVQGYFCRRIWLFSSSKLLSGAIMFLAFCQMCAGIAGGIMLRAFRPNAAKSSADTPVLTAWLVCAALVDVVIAACMTYFLGRAKTGLRASDALINRLVRLGIETGTITATVAIFDAIAFTAMPNTLVYECPALVLAKLYANTLVANLNNRAIMQRFGARTIDWRTSGIIFAQSGFCGAAATELDARHSSPRDNHVHMEVEHQEHVLSGMHGGAPRPETRGSAVGDSEEKGLEVLELANDLSLHPAEDDKTPLKPTPLCVAGTSYPQMLD